MEWNGYESQISITQKRKKNETHQAFNVESIFFIEKSHFAENALDVALSFLVIGEFECLVFVDFVFWYAQ